MSESSDFQRIDATSLKKILTEIMGKVEKSQGKVREIRVYDLADILLI